MANFFPLFFLSSNMKTLWILIFHIEIFSRVFRSYFLFSSFTSYPAWPYILRRASSRVINRRYSSSLRVRRVFNDIRIPTYVQVTYTAYCTCIGRITPFAFTVLFFLSKFSPYPHVFGYSVYIINAFISIRIFCSSFLPVSPRLRNSLLRVFRYSSLFRCRDENVNVRKS